MQWGYVRPYKKIIDHLKNSKDNILIYLTILRGVINSYMYYYAIHTIYIISN